MIFNIAHTTLDITSNENICVSTDDLEIKLVVEDYGLSVPFLRPEELASGTAGTREVLLPAIDYYKNELNRTFSKICLLQPTSPLRKAQHISEAHQLWDDELDMVVSVKESKANPYFNLFEDQENGFFKKSKEGNYHRRQDAPKAWEFNGAIYFINIQLLQAKPIAEFEKVRKYEMSEESSVDLDSKKDFYYIQLKLHKILKND